MTDPRKLARVARQALGIKVSDLREYESIRAYMQSEWSPRQAEDALDIADELVRLLLTGER